MWQDTILTLKKGYRSLTWHMVCVQAIMQQITAHRHKKEFRKNYYCSLNPCCVWLSENQRLPISPWKLMSKLSFLASVEHQVIKNSLTDRLPHTPLSCHYSVLASLSIILFHHLSCQRMRRVRDCRPERCQTAINGWLRLSVNRQSSQGQVSHSGSEVTG